MACKLEGAGKLRLFAIGNQFKQSLLRPVHDWCMQVLRTIPNDGTFHQTAPLRFVKEIKNFDFPQVSAGCYKHKLVSGNGAGDRIRRSGLCSLPRGYALDWL